MKRYLAVTSPLHDRYLTVEYPLNGRWVFDEQTTTVRRVVGELLAPGRSLGRMPWSEAPLPTTTPIHGRYGSQKSSASSSMGPVSSVSRYPLGAAPAAAPGAFRELQKKKTRGIGGMPW